MSQENDSASDISETLEERQRKRLIRHWKRRARILGPFLGIPLVFGALALSMDFVSHLPEAQVAKAQARAVKTRPLAKANRLTERLVRTPHQKSASLRRGSMIQPNTDSRDVFDSNSISLEISDANTDSARIPAQPFRERPTR